MKKYSLDIIRGFLYTWGGILMSSLQNCSQEGEVLNAIIQLVVVRFCLMGGAIFFNLTIFGMGSFGVPEGMGITPPPPPPSREPMYASF